ncbi:MAG TPA: hypothetical protein VGA99_14595 [bacterium]
MRNNNNNIQQVIDALLHPKYRWRTVSGIVKETKMSEKEVREYLEILMKKNKARKSYVSDPDGNDLYGLILRVDGVEV